MSEIKTIGPDGKPVRACINCAHGVLDERAKQVICHYMPPTPILMMIPNPAAVRAPDAPAHVPVNQALPPTVNPDWWCSKFRSKTEIVS